MAEITSDVYDVFHPTPVPLKELSAITISLEIWLREVMKYCTSDDALKTFYPGRKISLNTLLPGLPTVIYDVIGKYVTELDHSLVDWLIDHHNRVFHFDYDEPNHVLKHFSNFICDHRGSIDYARTAERMMHCDKFNLQQKFLIACDYFFEDDIRRLWPLVSSSFNLNDINFDKTPQLYYWICCLRNELDKIPVYDTNDNVDEVMLNALLPSHTQSVEYFWNRIPLENRVQKAVDLFRRGVDVQSLVRIILPEFTDQQLDEFINERKYDLMSALFNDVRYDEEFSLATWTQIRHIVNESAFTNQVRRMLLAENRESMIEVEFKVDLKDYGTRVRWSHLCCEIWNTTPEKLKMAAIRNITSADTDILFGGLFIRGSGIPIVPKEFEFFSTFLSCASSEQRRTFWYGNWYYLINDTRCEDFKKIMNLCLESDVEIIEFGKNEMVDNEYFRHIICFAYLRAAYFNELNEFVSIACPVVQAARNLKLQLLQSILDDEQFFIVQLIWNSEKFDQFIYDTYNNINLAENFKAQLVSSPLKQEELAKYCTFVTFEEFVQFIDAFVKDEQTLLQIKKRIVDHLKKEENANKSNSSVVSILSWCLGSEEERNE